MIDKNRLIERCVTQWLVDPVIIDVTHDVLINICTMLERKFEETFVVYIKSEFLELYYPDWSGVTDYPVCDNELYPNDPISAYIEVGDKWGQSTYAINNYRLLHVLGCAHIHVDYSKGRYFVVFDVPKNKTVYG